MTKTLQFTADVPGRRIDTLLSEHLNIPRNQAQKLIEEGRVKVGDRIAKSGQKVSPGDNVVVEMPAPLPTSPGPEDIPLNVVYEDDDVVVIEKPAGLVVHPAGGHDSGTLVNALLSRYPGIESGDTNRPGIVHRLDKDTSGLMVIAKNERAREKLVRQFKEKTLTKGYIALVAGHLTPEHGAIEAPIGRNPHERKRMAVVDGGRDAKTTYRVVRHIGSYTLVEAKPETGRTHQIRVHFAAIGHPVFGDPVYGKRSPLLSRQFLHAFRLGFKLPSTDKYVEFTSQLPGELAEALETIEK